MGKKSFNKGPKDPFADLTDDFKDAIEGASREEIERRIAKVAMDDVELRRAKKDDQDLKEKQEAAAFAAAVYRDGFKMNKMRIEYMKQALDDKGGPTKAKSGIESVTVTAGGKSVTLTAKEKKALDGIRNPGEGTKVYMKGIGEKEYVKISDDDRDGTTAEKAAQAGVTDFGKKVAEALSAQVDDSE